MFAAQANVTTCWRPSRSRMAREKLARRGARSSWPPAGRCSAPKVMQSVFGQREGLAKRRVAASLLLVEEEGREAPSGRRAEQSGGRMRRLFATLGGSRDGQGDLASERAIVLPCARARYCRA